MEDRSENKGEKGALPVVPYMAKEKGGSTGPAMALFRLGLGYIMFSLTTGFAMTVWDTTGRGALGSVMWGLPIVPLVSFVWLARRGRREYLIGYLMSVGTCGLLTGLCMWQVR